MNTKKYCNYIRRHKIFQHALLFNFGITIDYPHVIYPKFNLSTRSFIFDTLSTWDYFYLISVTHLY